MKDNQKSTSSVLLGTALLLLGTLFLLDNMGILRNDIVSYIFSLPGFIIFIGLIISINSRRKVFGISLLVLGISLMAAKIAGYPIHGNVFIPLLFILIGLNILLKNRQYSLTSANISRERNSEEFSSDRIEDISIFGGGNKNFRSENFQGGTVTVIFGGSEIDLTECKFAPGDQVIDVFVLFGGVELIVPYEWRVHIDVVPLFGGFGNKYRPDPHRVTNQQGLLRVKGLVLFGGGEIKYR